MHAMRMHTVDATLMMENYYLAVLAAEQLEVPQLVPRVDPIVQIPFGACAQKKHSSTTTNQMV